MTSPRNLSIAVVGNGIMGHGIAEVFATAGHNVILIGRSERSLNEALEKIRLSVADFVAEGLLPEGGVETAMALLSTSTELSDAAGASFVVEALPEDMELKRHTFLELDRICRPDAILATSSGHPASEVSDGLTHPDRVLATHFWYPPQLLPLVEVCATPSTRSEVVERSCDLLRRIGKEPVVIDREIDGFIGNRIQFAALREAWFLWAAGVASASAIDAVVRNSIGRRYAITGPIESADLGGLPVMVNFASFLQPALSVDAQPPSRLADLASTPGATVHGRSEQDHRRLLEARRRELIRWIAVDREQT